MTYGRDSHCYDRLVTGRLASGYEVLAQAAYRRLTTARGTLDDGDEGAIYGLDISDFVGRVGDATAVDALTPLVEAELLKDDRFETVRATATAVTDAAGLTSIILSVEVTPRDVEDPFTLSLAVSAVTVALLGVTT